MKIYRCNGSLTDKTIGIIKKAIRHKQSYKKLESLIRHMSKLSEEFFEDDLFDSNNAVEKCMNILKSFNYHDRQEAVRTFYKNNSHVRIFKRNYKHHFHFLNTQELHPPKKDEASEVLVSKDQHNWPSVYFYCFQDESDGEQYLEYIAEHMNLSTDIECCNDYEGMFEGELYSCEPVNLKSPECCNEINTKEKEDV